MSEKQKRIFLPLRYVHPGTTEWKEWQRQVRWIRSNTDKPKWKFDRVTFSLIAGSDITVGPVITGVYIDEHDASIVRLKFGL